MLRVVGHGGFRAGLLLGAGAAAAVALLLGPVARTPDVGAAPPVVREGGAEPTAARLDALEQRLYEIVGLLRSRPQAGPVLEGPSRPPEAAAASGTGDAGTPTAPPAVGGVTEDMLVSAIERAEERKIDRMPAGEAIQEAARRAREGRDLPGAKRIVARLLERELEGPVRVQATIALATYQRSLGDHAGSEKTLRGLIASEGVASDAARVARYQLGWTLSAASEDAGALALFEDLARGQSDDATRWGALWSIVLLSRKTGDERRAASALEELRREGEKNVHAMSYVTDLEKRK